MVVACTYRVTPYGSCTDFQHLQSPPLVAATADYHLPSKKFKGESCCQNRQTSVFHPHLRRQQRSDRIFQPPAPGTSFSHFFRGRFSSPKDRSLPGNLSRSEVRFTQNIDSFDVFFTCCVWLPKAFHPPTRKNGKKPCHCLQTLQFFRSLTCQGLSESQTIVADLDTTEDSAKLK